MRGIESPWGDPESFPELLSVTKADPNNFCFPEFFCRRLQRRVSGRRRRKKKERKNTCEKNGKRVACGARDSPVPNICYT